MVTQLHEYAKSPKLYTALQMGEFYGLWVLVQ